MASAARSLVLHALLVAAAIAGALSDPTPLQDICVADLQAGAATAVDGFPCKLLAAVVDDDFFSGALMFASNTTNPFGVNSMRATVVAFPGLNTLGVSITHTDLAPGGLNPPHFHRRASELIMVLNGEVSTDSLSPGNREGVFVW